VTIASNIAGQESLIGTNPIIQDCWFIDLGVVWVHILELYDKCISRDLFNAQVFRK